MAVTSIIALESALTSCSIWHPNALWEVVADHCVPEQQSQGHTTSCVSVDLAHRWAVYKDTTGQTQFLLIPTDRVTGVEDPAVLRDDTPNYWEAAWNARSFVRQRAS